MDNTGFSASDVLALNRDSDGWGGSNIVTLLLLFALTGGGFGWNRGGDFGQYATAASQTEILLGQQFQNLDNKIDRIGNGICDSTYALNNAVHSAQDSTLVSRYELGSQIDACCCKTNGNIDQVRYDMSLAACGIKENDNANTQKILDAIHQDKVEALQGKISQLELQAAMCGVVRYPLQTSYFAGWNPFYVAPAPAATA